MLSKRTLASFAQLFELFETTHVIVMFGKHELRLSVEGGALLFSVNAALRSQSTARGVMSLLEEVVRTQGDLRSRINPKYRFDERFDDLALCLQLDGYKVESRRVIPQDPSIQDTPPIEDELHEALTISGLDPLQEIRQKLTTSAEAFRQMPPNFNACLNDSRVALESIVRQVASSCVSPVGSYDSSKWGSMLTYLRQNDFLSLEEEQGLAGAYRFLSPGSHRPIGLTDAEMSRLGRAIAMSMCWFTVKRYCGLRRA
jgi:hypothetical protein